MLPTNPISPIPKGLGNLLPEPKTPWQISSRLFARIAEQSWEDANMSYKKCQVYQEDPEGEFILQYFNQHKPSNYSISNVYCIHSPSLTQVFEATLEQIDKKAETFKPEWNNEGHLAERKQVIHRWKEQANGFYPITIKKPTREDTYVNVRVLPLWHGTTTPVCSSIASSGFTYFGKHHFFNPNAKSGKFKNTDPGYFGSGIYFTNSAKYASMYNSGNLLLAWVSMKEPFPVINDVPHPQKGTDMRKLEGQGAYQTYNAHFIPVAPTNNYPSCMEYYPCYSGQAPVCDEFVVFQEAQTLPRFWIELSLDLPKLLPSYPPILTASLSPPSTEEGKFGVEWAKVDDPSRYCHGLNFDALCASSTCHNQSRQVYKIGIGEHNIAREICKLQCSSCQKIANLQKLIFWNCQYKIEGQQSTGEILQTEGVVGKERLKMHLFYGGWNYLQIATKGENHV